VREALRSVQGDSYLPVNRSGVAGPLHRVCRHTGRSPAKPACKPRAALGRAPQALLAACEAQALAWRQPYIALHVYKASAAPEADATASAR
jgi:hypothetical protein